MTPQEAEATRAYIEALRDSAKLYAAWAAEGGRLALYYARERDRCIDMIEWNEATLKEYGNEQRRITEAA